MEREARQRVNRELPDLDAVRWQRPPDWEQPPWLDDEPEAGLPMSPDRFHWVCQVIGWSKEELARRVHTHESSIRQMGRGRRAIPDTLALWLEDHARRVLDGSLVPIGWRPKPEQAEVVG